MLKANPDRICLNAHLVWKCCNFAVTPVVGWQDAPPGIFGLWSIQVAPV